jgi:hypothetical protein
MSNEPVVVMPTLREMLPSRQVLNSWQWLVTCISELKSKPPKKTELPENSALNSELHSKSIAILHLGLSDPKKCTLARVLDGCHFPVW